MENEEIKQRAKSVFGQNAEKYVTSEIHAKGDDLSLTVQWLQPQSDWVVLDIATGGGHVAKTIAPHVSAVFATDLTEKMLANTARHLKKDYRSIWHVIADAEALPFLEDTFDLITCCITPHHFTIPKEFIIEVARVLKPGGKFLLIDNVAPEDESLDEFMNTVERLRDESHVRCLTINEWKNLFGSSGLQETRSLNRKKTFQFPSWVARTTTSQEQIDRVQQYMLAASGNTQKYFSVVINNNQIQSHEIDEWMVLCEKNV